MHRRSGVAIGFLLRPLLAVLAAIAPATAPACELLVSSARIYVASPNARAAAVYMDISNPCATHDRLTGASSEIARKAILHSQEIDLQGVARMRPILDGLELPAGAATGLIRGGDHIMLMGLNRKLQEGDQVELQLYFETAGTVELRIPVSMVIH